MLKAREQSTSLVLATLILTLFVLASDCGTGLGGNCENVQFTLDPDTSTGLPQFVIDATACPHAPTTDACSLEIFDIAGDDRYFQYGTGTCAGIFDAHIENGSGVYTLMGNTLRGFGNGAGAFAEGTYYKDGDPSHYGSFSFHEGGFHS